MHPKKETQTETPVPVLISVHLTFLDPGLEGEDFEKEVRKVVQEQLKDALPGWLMPEGVGGDLELMAEYDDWLRDIIREELSRN